MKSLFTLLLLLCCISGNAYFHAYAHHSEEYHPGFIVFQNNDTLYGAFKVNYRGKISYSKNGAVETKRIDEHTIDKLFLSATSEKIYVSKGYVEFDYISKEQKLWRLIYIGKNKYYDDNIHSNSSVDNIGTRIALLKRGNPDSILHLDESCVAKKSLVRFLNQKSNSSYRNKDFKTSIDVIKLIEQYY